MATVDPVPGGFCARAWANVGGLVRAIVDHRFNRQLEAGTLDAERFAYYLVQDARYLTGFARALAGAASRAPGTGDGAFLAGSARDALVVERALHAEYLEAMGVAAETIATSPSCLAYSSYLQAVVLGEPYQVAVAALLPCFWIYEHVGAGIVARAGDLTVHPYRRWITTYGAEEFAESAAAMRAVVDRAAEGAGEAAQEAMMGAFCRACEYEWMFWESAWTLEEWPTAALLGGVD